MFGGGCTQNVVDLMHDATDRGLFVQSWQDDGHCGVALGGEQQIVSPVLGLAGAVFKPRLGVGSHYLLPHQNLSHISDPSHLRI